ncbi:MAG: uracil-DNA glycosylase family protein [Candidatus Thiodiazotropha sp.]|jgi:uracil-DNA glycosylase
MSNLQAIISHQTALRQCRDCPDMRGPVVVGNPVLSPVLLVGQAPGDREGPAGKPFAWTAGKTLFRWFEQIGLTESAFRQQVYMAAVCRCFPGKLPKGGDRVPSGEEIARCRRWLDAEIALLQPRLILPVGKLAIAQFLAVGKLTEVIGARHSLRLAGREVDIIPLPHPSGASTWHRTEPGKGLLQRALRLIERHPAWREARMG